MGMYDKWFGGKQDYPPLPADNEAMAKLGEMKAQLEELGKKVVVIPSRGLGQEVHEIIEGAIHQDRGGDT